MQLLRVLLVFSTVITSALAQVNAALAFTSVPGVAIVGGSYNITWTGGDGSSPVTLLLKEGPSNRVVTISIIGDGITGYSYIWNVSRTLASGVDYSLQLIQGQGAVGYSGQFSIIGGTGTISINAPGYTLPASSSAAINSSLASATSAASANMTSNAATPSMNMTMAANSTMTNSTMMSSTMMNSSMSATAASMSMSMSSSMPKTSSMSSSMSMSMSSGASAGASATSGSAATGVQTNFPTVTMGPGAVNVPPQWASFAALMIGVVGAVMGMA